MLHQVPVPLPFVGRTYGELVAALLLLGGSGSSSNAGGGSAKASLASKPHAADYAPRPAPWAHEVPLGLLRRKSENRGWRCEGCLKGNEAGAALLGGHSIYLVGWRRQAYRANAGAFAHTIQLTACTNPAASANAMHKQTLYYVWVRRLPCLSSGIL
jgi:hypothetical protein